MKPMTWCNHGSIYKHDLYISVRFLEDEYRVAHLPWAYSPSSKACVLFLKRKLQSWFISRTPVVKRWHATHRRALQYTVAEYTAPSLHRSRSLVVKLRSFDLHPHQLILVSPHTDNCLCWFALTFSGKQRGIGTELLGSNRSQEGSTGCSTLFPHGGV